MEIRAVLHTSLAPVENEWKQKYVGCQRAVVTLYGVVWLMMNEGFIYNIYSNTHMCAKEPWEE